MGPRQRADRPTDVPSSLVGVYRGRDEAAAVVQQVRERGIDPTHVRVGEQADVDLSLLAETQEATSRSSFVPSVGIYPREAAKGGVALGLPITLLCGLLVLPLGFIPMGGVALWLRLLIAFGIGIFGGGAAAMVIGPAMSAKRPNEVNAAQRGVVVRVDQPTAAVEEVMVTMDPIRVDRVMLDQPIPLETLVTEEEFTSGGIVEEIKRNAEDPRREDLPGRPHEGVRERRSA